MKKLIILMAVFCSFSAYTEYVWKFESNCHSNKNSCIEDKYLFNLLTTDELRINADCRKEPQLFNNGCTDQWRLFVSFFTKGKRYYKMQGSCYNNQKSCTERLAVVRGLNNIVNGEFAAAIRAECIYDTTETSDEDCYGNHWIIKSDFILTEGSFLYSRSGRYTESEK